MTPQDVLRGAAAIIEKPGAWIQGERALDAHMRLCLPSADEAVCFCAAGAAQRVHGRIGPRFENSAYFQALDAFKHVNRTQGFAAFNDMCGRTQGEVVAALHRAADSLDAA